LKRVQVCALSGRVGIGYWDENWCNGKDSLAIEKGAFVECQVVIASGYARGYRPIKMLNSTAAFASEETWARRHRHVDICLCGDEVNLQQLVARRKTRARKTGRAG